MRRCFLKTAESNKKKIFWDFFFIEKRPQPTNNLPKTQLPVRQITYQMHVLTYQTAWNCRQNEAKWAKNPPKKAEEIATVELTSEQRFFWFVCFWRPPPHHLVLRPFVCRVRPYKRMVLQKNFVFVILVSVFVVFLLVPFVPQTNQNSTKQKTHVHH